MSPADLTAARITLATLWGLERLTLAQMGRVLGVGGARPDQPIRNYEEGATEISGPVALAIEALLSGWRPADLAERLGVEVKAAAPAVIEDPVFRRVKRAEATRVALAASVVIGPVASAPGSRLKKGR